MDTAKYFELLPNVGQIIKIQDKWWEITKLESMSEESGQWVTYATCQEVDDEAADVGNEPIKVCLDSIDYISSE